MLKNCRGESKERCLKKAGQTPASYFPCALSQQMYFPSVNRFPNVFCLLSSSFLMYLSLYFASLPTLNRFQMYLKLFPIVSANVFCLLSISSLTIVPASTPDCLLQSLSDSKQQFLYMLIAHRLYFLSALFCNITVIRDNRIFQQKQEAVLKAGGVKRWRLGFSELQTMSEPQTLTLTKL